MPVEMTPIPEFFVPPKKLHEMTTEQKEELKTRYDTYVRTVGNTSETSPSRVFSEQELERFAARRAANRRDRAEPAPQAESNSVIRTRFVPGKGFVVSGEDPVLLASLGVDVPESSSARMLTREQAKDLEMDDMPPAHRDAEERFRSL